MHDRDGSDGHLCDVCYWRKRAVAAELGRRDMVIDELLAALEDVLRVGRGSSGRIILEAEDETVIREAIASAKGGKA